METRYLYIDGVFKDPVADDEEEDIDDGKSDVSALTNKTSKSTKSKSGKALDKHCPLCNLKLIRGKNWSRHCKDLHKEAVV